MTGWKKVMRWNAPPLRYADQKMQFARKIKFEMALILKGIITCESWVEIPAEYWESVRKSDHHKRDLQTALDLDNHKVYEAQDQQLPTALHQRGFLRANRATQPKHSNDGLQ